MARRPTARPRPEPPRGADLPVFERTLGNGLKAIALATGHAPIVVSDLYYPVGSVDEPPGPTGLAHFVEHMLFKGTARFAKGQVDRLAFVAGGQLNAETAEDFSHYWFAFPSGRWELALAIEADRMAGASFDPAEVEGERRVIIEERARDLDSPLARLDQAHLNISYLRHPYRNPIIGWPEDIARIDVDALKAFHRAHYRPDGAVLVVVGDVDPARALDRIEAHFEGLRPGEVERPGPPPGEPRQSGRREFALIDSESTARGLFGWHSTPRGHPDGPALDVLSDILSCGRRSRLWDRLVEHDRLATWLDAGHEPSKLAGQFLVQLEAAPGVDPGRLEGALLDVINEVADEGPTPEELGRSCRRLEAAWRWEQEDAAGLAAGLGQAALEGDWRIWQAEHRAAMDVSAEDVRRVASTYLADSGLTAGWSLPRPVSAVTVLLPAEISSRPPCPAATTPSAEFDAMPDLVGVQVAEGVVRLVDYRPSRVVLPNGLRVLTETRPGSGVVALELFVDAGMLREAKPGLAHLTGRLLEEGTANRTAEALAEAIEDVGAALDVGATGASLRIRAEDLPLAVEILADLAIRPAFPADAFPWAKRKVVAELQGDRDDPAFRADLVFRGLVYGSHPYARDPRGGIREVGRLTLDDVREHHSRHFTPGNAFLVAVGDFDPGRLRKLVDRAFGGWSPRASTPGGPARLVRSARPKVRRVAHPGAQVNVIMGHLGVARTHREFDALIVLDHIFGTGPGFADRLGRILRDEMGLVYSVGGGMTDSADLAPGAFRIAFGTGPDEADRAVATVAEQVRAMHAGAFGDDEVDRVRDYLAGAWVFDYQSAEQRAERLLEIERFGLGLDDPITWPDRIARVTPRQVRKAARAHLDPAALSRVEYGPVRRRGQSPDAECA